MRKLIVFLMLVAACLLTQPILAFDAVSAAGFGWVMQEGSSSELGYIAGFEVPVVEKAKAGYAMKTEISYLYSDYGGEIQVLRTFAINQKYLYSRQDVDFYIGLGGGVWHFIKTVGDDETFGAFTARFGAEWKDIDFKLSVDVVPVEGSDVFYPGLGISFLF